MFLSARRKGRGDINRQRALFTVSVAALIIIMSFLTILRPYGVVRNVSAVETISVGVYWNNECTEAITLIDWETLSPGSHKTVEVFIRNENASPIWFLFVKTQNWTPPAASNNMRLYLGFAGEKINPNEVVQATLTLYVSEKIAGIEYFEFNIIVSASQYIAGDVDHDGDVDVRDFAFFGYSYGSTPNSIRWNPNADFDASEKVDIYDFSLLSTNYGKYTY